VVLIMVAITFRMVSIVWRIILTFKKLIVLPIRWKSTFYSPPIVTRYLHCNFIRQFTYVAVDITMLPCALCPGRNLRVNNGL